MLDMNLATPKSLKFRIGLFVAGFEAFSAIALAATSGYLISRAAEMPPVMYLMVAVVGVRAFALGRAGARYFQRLLLHDAVFRNLSSLRPKLFQKVSSLTPSFGGRSKSSDLNRLTSDVDELENLGLRIISPLIQVLTALVFITALVSFNFAVAGIVVGILSLAFIGLVGALSHIAATEAERSKATTKNQLSINLTSYLQNIDLLNSYGWADAKRKEIAAAGKLQLGLDSRIAKSLGLATSLISLGAVFVAVSSGYFAGLELESGKQGTLLAIVILAPLAAFEIFSGVQGAVGAIAKFSIGNSRIIELLDTNPLPEVLIAEGEIELGKFESLRLSSVSIQRGEKVVLRDLSLEIAPGDFLAITGPSGSGKTSLALALCSLIAPVTGEIQLNGKSFDDYSILSRRKSILLIEQQAHVFAGTVRQNLEISGVSDESKLQAALEKVGLWETFAQRAGLDTKLSQDAINVSGGEAQRLAIARGLLASSSVLVLDEPTSGLDSKNASNLVMLLKGLCADGMAVAMVTHDELLASSATKRIELSNRS